MLPDFRVRQRDYLLEISRAITEELDLETVLARIMRIAVELLASHAGLIALREAEGGWRVAASHGINQNFLKNLDPLLGDIPDHGDPARFALPEVNRRLRRIAEAATMGLLSGVGLTMIAGREVVGVIFVFRSYRGPFSSDDRSLLQDFATQAAIAVQNARLYSQVTEQKRHLEFGRREYDAINEHCHTLGIAWFASTWDLPSLEFLKPYALPYNKVASAMLTHDLLVESVAAEGKETFISTGMSTLSQVQHVVDAFRSFRCPFVLMHTVSTYPTPDDQLNLRCLETLRKLHPRVGYSGHEVSPLPSIIAAALGAEVIERHITLDRSMYGSDQAASLERRGLEVLVDGIRRLPGYLGDGVKRLMPGEAEVSKKLRYWEGA